jgi:predicted nucleotidyltransferase
MQGCCLTIWSSEMSKVLSLKDEELKLVRHILGHCIPGATVQAFGSRTNDTAKPHSDLDLAVLTGQPLTFLQGAMLTEAFEESDLPFKVDVCDWATLSESFKLLIEPSFIEIEI